MNGLKVEILEDEEKDHDHETKISEIRSACASRDIESLRDLAISRGGFINDECRSKAWPILLGSDQESSSPDSNSQNLDKHRDEDQVELDVDRSFIYYPGGESETRRNARKVELNKAIIEVLRRYPFLHYFQGYHDIVQVILLVLGSNATVPAVARMSLLRIRDYMLPTMAGTEFHLRLLPSILNAADPKVYSHLSQTQPFFALSATLTLYAHVIDEYGDIARLFDFLLAGEAVIPLYLFAVIAVSRKEELLDIPQDEPEMLHSILSKLPKPLNLENLINKTVELFNQYPPEKLPGKAWARVPASSVLKTTRPFSLLQKQTPEDGQRFFEQEASHIRRREVSLKRQRRFWNFVLRYQRPAAWTGAALLVAFAAMYWQGDGAFVYAVEKLPRWIDFRPMKLCQRIMNIAK